MPIEASITLLTERDIDILAALDMTPLTAEQLCRLSRAFALPFADTRRVRERLRILAEARRVSAFRYATEGPGAPAYYVLTPLGYRLLHGPEATLPPRRQFMPIGIARQRHTFALAEFLVHTAVAAHAVGAKLANHARENAVRLTVGSDAVVPDAAFQLAPFTGKALSFTVELDNRSERVRSDKEADSWQRKVRLYEAYADHAPSRFRVLLVTTGGEARLRNMLQTARQHAKNPHRALVYGTTLSRYLAESAAVTTPCWQDHHLRVVGLLTARSTRDAPAPILLP